MSSIPREIRSKVFELMGKKGTDRARRNSMFVFVDPSTPPTVPRLRPSPPRALGEYCDRVGPEAASARVLSGSATLVEYHLYVDKK